MAVRGRVRPYGGQASVYDHEYRDYVDDIPFFLGRLQAARVDGPLLDLGTGSGRVALPLARAGYTVVGLDCSQEMLARARRRRRAEPREVAARLRFRCADIGQFSVGQRFGAVLLSFSTLALLPEREQRQACLRCCHAHLSPGGLLLIDLFAPRMLDGPAVSQPVRYHDSFTIEGPGHLVEKETEERSDPDQPVVHVRYRYRRLRPRDHRLLDEFTVEFSLARISAAELELDLLQLGFELPQIFGDYQGFAYGPGSDRMIFETSRPRLAADPLP